MVENDDDLLPAVSAGVSSRWAYRYPLYIPNILLTRYPYRPCYQTSPLARYALCISPRRSDNHTPPQPTALLGSLRSPVRLVPRAYDAAVAATARARARCRDSSDLLRRFGRVVAHESRVGDTNWAVSPAGFARCFSSVARRLPPRNRSIRTLRRTSGSGCDRRAPSSGRCPGR